MTESSKPGLKPNLGDAPIPGSDPKRFAADARDVRVDNRFATGEPFIAEDEDSHTLESSVGSLRRAAAAIRDELARRRGVADALEDMPLLVGAHGATEGKNKVISDAIFGDSETDVLLGGLGADTYIVDDNERYHAASYRGVKYIVMHGNGMHNVDANDDVVRVILNAADLDIYPETKPASTVQQRDRAPSGQPETRSRRSKDTTN